MPSIGHGISDAVRGHIPIWVDDQLVTILYDEYRRFGGVLSKDNPGGFRSRIKNSSDWIRKSRKSNDKGFERTYVCKTVQKASLIVYSPPDDKSANAYVFCVDGHPVAGGKTKLKSTHVSKVLSTKDKTTTDVDDVVFVKFTTDELRKMKTQMQFGNMSFLEIERSE